MVNDPPLNQSRRAFLKTTGLAVGGLGAAGTASAHDDDDDRYIVKQGDRCFRIKPLEGEKRVEKFYKWGEEERYFSSTGTKSLQRKDTSILFLYDGPKGLSLVIVHGALKDGSDGGAVSFKIKDIPRKAEWVVKDDYYDSDSNYDRWDIEKRSAKIDWTWNEERTDGGALRGLDVDDLDLTIYPKFNKEAKLYGKHYDGRIKRWEVLSGDRKDPDRYKLQRDEKLRLKRGRCDDDDHHHDDDDDDHHDDDKDWDDDHDKDRDRDHDDKDKDHDKDRDKDKDRDRDHDDKDRDHDDKDRDHDHDKDRDHDRDHDKDKDHDKDRDHDDKDKDRDRDHDDKDKDHDHDKNKDHDRDHDKKDDYDDKKDDKDDKKDDDKDDGDEKDGKESKEKRDGNDGREKGKKKGKEKDKRGPPEHSNAPKGAGPPN